MSGEAQDWEAVRLGDIAAINPESLGQRTDPNFAFGYIDISQIATPGVCAGWTPFTFGTAPSRARRTVRENDILVSTVRPYLRAFAMVPSSDSPLVASTGFAVIRAHRDVDQNFLFQHIMAAEFVEHLKPRMSGSNYPAVSAGDISDYEFLCPPLNEQRQIAEVLDSVNGSLAAADAAIECLGDLLTSLRCSLMSDPSSPSEGANRVSIHDVCRPRQHPTISSQQLTDSGFPAYGANGQIGFYTTYTHADPVIAITCRGATCGTINWIPARSYVTGNAMALDDVRHDRINERFLFHYLSAWGVTKSITGSAQPQITRQSLNGIEIVLPSMEEQHIAATALDDILIQIENARAARMTLDTIRSQVTADLLSGRVRVPA
ncbi:MAG: hypothetical protein DI531_15570 [Brevundimonas sp.]|uniref:restriction endonuclease subunit S n=1 Tax=Brevundimonas sp. TaxID=1871086 RepID=UPI000DB81D7B|nr:restriction endonuclease subunit S [Brevundimonas sp.]PZU71598.1 MAG: hypothetical protein DI531_15570 [Brevundimonas sp.]